MQSKVLPLTRFWKSTAQLFYLAKAVDVQNPSVNLILARDHAPRVHLWIKFTEFNIVILKLIVAACHARGGVVCWWWGVILYRQLANLIDEEFLTYVEKAHHGCHILALALNKLDQVELLLDFDARFFQPCLNSATTTASERAEIAWWLNFCRCDVLLNCVREVF